MSAHTPLAGRQRRRLWHPMTGALVVAAPGLAVVALAAAGGVGDVLLGVSAFLVMGAVAGFAVSGST